MAHIVSNYIDGEFVPAKSGKTYSLFRPEDRRVSATASASDFMDFIAATQSAVKHGDKWQKIPFSKKIEALKKLLEALEKNREAFEKLLRVHLGYTQRAAQQELTQALLCAQDLIKDVSPSDEGALPPNPYGLCLFYLSAVSPVYFFFLTVFPALLTGNQVILRPHFQTSPIFDGLLQIYRRIDIAQAVLQVVYCEDFAMDKDLVAHPAIRFVYYMGDYPFGSALQKEAHLEGKPFFMECGGRNSVIFGRDVDFENLGTEILHTLFSVHFLSCYRGSRVFIPDNCWDSHLKGLYGLFKTRVAEEPPGSLWSREHAQKYHREVRVLAEEEYELIRITKSDDGVGPMVATPCVAEEVSNCLPLQQEKLSGPLITLTRYKNMPEAIKFANTSPWGLVSYIFHGDTIKAKKWAHELNSGLVFVNQFAKDLHKLPLHRFGHSGQSFSGTYLELFQKQKTTVIGTAVEPLSGLLEFDSESLVFPADLETDS